MTESMAQDLRWLADHIDRLTGLSKSLTHEGSADLERAFAALETAQAALMDEPLIPSAGSRYRTSHTYSLAQYYTEGAKAAAIFHHLGRMKSDSRVLEVGSGAGRVSLPIKWYLHDGGKLYGVDVSRRLVEETQALFGDSRCEFRYMDVHVPRYNPEGRFSQLDYRFEFDDGFFDVICLNSVFTHMRLDVAAHYLREFHRLLRPGGRVVFSVLVYDREGPGTRWPASNHFKRFVPADKPDALGKVCWTVNPKEPERALAHAQQDIADVVQAAQLVLVDQPAWGRWSGSPDYTLWQDYLTAERR